MAGKNVRAMPIIWGKTRLNEILRVRIKNKICGTISVGKMSAKRPDPENKSEGIKEASPQKIVVSNNNLLIHFRRNLRFFTLYWKS